MQDNSNAGGYNAQNQDSPYDDQITTPVPQGQAPTVYNQEPQAGQPISPAPVAQKKPAVPRKILIGGAIVLFLLILGIAGAIIVPRLTANNQAPAPTPVAASTPTANPAARNPYAPYLTQYRAGIRSQIAQNLHLSSDQLQTQLSSGQTLSAIATTQKISTTQLQTIVTNAFQSGFQPAIMSGNLTQKQVDLLVRRMIKQPKALDRYLVAQARVRKGVGVTPTAVSQ